MLAGGPDKPISIIPAAAAPDDNHQLAGRNGVAWFRQLGATNVSAVPVRWYFVNIITTRLARGW